MSSLTNIRPIFVVHCNVVHISDNRSVVNARSGFIGCHCGEYLKGELFGIRRNLEHLTTCSKCFLYFVPMR